MTAVLFKFSHPDGTPVVDAPFLVTTRKPSFDETLDNGIQLPGDVEGVTDAQGEATLELMAGFATYYLLMDQPGAVAGEDGCVAGLRYRFMVAESATTVRVEDLIVTTPTWSRPWDEAAIQVILDAKVASLDAAVRAEEARDDAMAQTGIIDGIAEETRIAAAAALVSRDQAEGFAVAANASSVATAADVLLTHQDVVLTHADVLTAEASQLAAGNSAIAAQASADASEASALRSETAADQSDGVLVLATAAKDTAVTKAGEASASAAQVADDKTIVLAAKDVTLAARDEAVEAAQTTVGALIEAGGIDLSGGVYPAKPLRASIWKVTAGGVVTGEHGDTYGVGDSLIYSKTVDYFYKMDNTESVASVAGKTGVVVLVKADVGLDLVDNTSDLNKPVSTAQQAANDAQDTAMTTALGLKVAIADIINTLTSTVTNKPLSAAQGKALSDLIAAAYTKTEADALLLTKVDKTAVIDIAHGGTGAITAPAARVALGIGSQGGKNLLINPRFIVNQRGYVSGAATSAALQYTLDRWRVVVSGQNVSFVASNGAYRITAPAGGIEEVVLAENMRAGVHTLSWIGTATAKVNGVAIANGGQTASLPALTNAVITFAGGTVEDAKFEYGTVATAFEPLDYAAELHACQYYGYALKPDVANQPICSVAFIYAARTGVGVLRFPRTMRVSPSVVFLAGSPASLAVIGGGGGGIALDNLQITAIGRDSCQLGAVISTDFAFGYSTVLMFGASPNLFFSAEITT